MLALTRVRTLDDDRSESLMRDKTSDECQEVLDASAGGRPLPSSPWTIAFRPPLAGGFLYRNFYTMLKHEFYDGFSVKILQIFA